MSNASVMTVRIPADLKRRIEVVAEEQGVSLNQLAMYMFTREVTSLETGSKISKYWDGYKKSEILHDFDDVMGKVKDTRVPVWDRIEKTI
jgi:hypothetical protein